MESTSDERHEVAERLRGYIVYARRHDLDGDYAKESDKCVDTRSTLYNDIASCIEEFGNFNLSAEQVFIRLADLIDPTCEVDYRRYLYGRCAYEYHLSCGHSVDRPWRTPPAYCPECGARCIAGEGDGDED